MDEARRATCSRRAKGKRQQMSACVGSNPDETVCRTDNCPSGAGQRTVRKSGVKYERMSVAPARTMHSDVSYAMRRSS